MKKLVFAAGRGMYYQLQRLKRSIEESAEQLYCLQFPVYSLEKLSCKCNELE